MANVRGHNEGSLFPRRRDGRWVAMVTMPDGRRRSASAASKSEGVALLREPLRQRDQAISTMRVTADFYAHVPPTLRREAADRRHEALS